MNLQIGCISKKNLKRDATTLAVLDKDSTVNESLVQVLLLEPSIGNIISTSRLFEDTDLVLSLTTQVARDKLSSSLETLAALGVVHLDSAVSVSYALCLLKQTEDLLLLVIEGDGKVLPFALEHGGLPEKLVLLIKELPGIGLELLADEGTGLELELVSREIGLFMPDVLYLLVQATKYSSMATYQVLVAEIERPARILHDTKVKSLNTLRPRAALVGVLAELQTSTSETELLHEDALIADGDLERKTSLCSIEARAGLGLGQLEDLRPSDIVSLDEAWVVGVPASTVLLVEVGQRRIGGHAAVEDHGTGLGAGVETVAVGSG
jgi:hypothetical protein